MLQALRSGAKSAFIRYALFGVLLLAMLGLALIGGSRFDKGAMHKSYVAKIGGDKISGAQFDITVQNALRQQNVPQSKALESGIPQQALQQEVSRRVLARASDDIGISVDNPTAARQIKAMLQPLIEKGMKPKEALDRFLQAYNLSEAQLVGSIKTEIATDMLNRMLSEGVTLPEQMVTDALKYKYEYRKGDYFTLPASAVGKIPEPTDADLEKTYAAIKQRFMTPESRTFSVVVLDKKSLGVDTAAVTDDEVKAYYDEHQKDMGAPETRTLSQVVAKDEDSAKKIAASGLKDTQSLKVVKDTYKEKDLPSDLSGPVFKAEEGKIVTVKSPLGWHVIRVEKVMTPSRRTFDNMKAELRHKIEQDKSSEGIYAKADEIENKIDGGKSLEEVAGDFNLKPVEFKNVTADQKVGENIPMIDKVRTAVFRVGKGEATQLIETPGGDFLIAEVHDITPATPKALSVVRADVVKEWQEQKLATALQAKASEIVEKVKAGKTIDALAADYGAKITKTDFIKRGGTGATPQIVSSLFTMDNNEQIVPVLDKDSIVVLKLTERKVDVPANARKDDMSLLQNVLTKSLQKDIEEQYRQALFKKYDVVINSDLLNDMYKPKSEQDQP